MKTVTTKYDQTCSWQRTTLKPICATDTNSSFEKTLFSVALFSEFSTAKIRRLGPNETNNVHLPLRSPATAQSTATLNRPDCSANYGTICGSNPTVKTDCWPTRRHAGFSKVAGNPLMFHCIPVAIRVTNNLGDPPIRQSLTMRQYHEKRNVDQLFPGRGMPDRHHRRWTTGRTLRRTSQPGQLGRQHLQR